MDDEVVKIYTKRFPSIEVIDNLIHQWRVFKDLFKLDGRPYSTRNCIREMDGRWEGI